MTDPGVKAQIGERMEKMAIPPAAIARAIAFAIEQPAEVDVNEIVIRPTAQGRSEEHTSELQSQSNLVCRLLLEKKKKPASRLHDASSDRLVQEHHVPLPAANERTQFACREGTGLPSLCCRTAAASSTQRSSGAA